MACHPFARRLPIVTLILLTLPVLLARASDEFSSGDKLRTLYSNHFSFTDDGLPQVTIEIMGGQKQVKLGSKDGVIMMPDGDGGARVEGAKQWTVRLENSRPAVLRGWSIVAHFPASEGLDAEVAVAQWKKRGHKVKSFETGTIFAVRGEVLDTREILVGVDPVSPAKAAAKARELSKRYDLTTTVHKELVKRPSGTIVARSGDMVVRNPAVLWFASSKTKGTIAVDDVVIGGGGSQLKTSKEDRRYFGSVYVTIGSDGKLAVVNAVAANDLLAGLVPSEMFADAPMEALRAQAVAARTELMQKLGARHFGDPFLLCASQHCQVYSGAGHEHPRTTKAVQSTRGQVLLDPKKHLVDARYSATCGGHSEHNESVWGGEADPVLRGRPDSSTSKRFAKGITDRNISSFLDASEGAYCAKTKWSKGRYRWKVTVSADQLSQRIAKTYPGVGRLLSLKPLLRGVSGRIIELQLKGLRGTQVVEGELTIRRLLGGLRSSLFTSTGIGPANNPTSFIFRGAGFGHGVGMCQIGAVGMADQGRSLAQILLHYYTASSLHKLY